MSAANDFGFDFFDPEEEESDLIGEVKELSASEIEELVDTLIEGAFAFEGAVVSLTKVIEVSDKDSTVLWTALKVLDAYQGLLNRASIHQQVKDLDTP